MWLCSAHSWCLNLICTSTLMMTLVSHGLSLWLAWEINRVVQKSKPLLRTQVGPTLLPQGNLPFRDLKAWLPKSLSMTDGMNGKTNYKIHQTQSNIQPAVVLSATTQEYRCRMGCLLISHVQGVSTQTRNMESFAPTYPPFFLIENSLI